MAASVWITLAAEALVFALLLFGAAGTPRWLAGWVFLVLFFGGTLHITRTIARHDPALLAERMKPPIQRDQPLWDKVLLSTLIVLFAAWLVLMGLDAVRFGWSAVPAWVQGIGAAGIAVALWICFLAFRENTFLAPVVKIQAERGHRVVSTGPYAIVRHPLYAGALVLLPSMALLLGSWTGLAAAAVLVGLLAVRTALEDRELRRGLAGYRDYAGRVRYRLVPWIW